MFTLQINQQTARLPGIIIPVHNAAPELDACLASLRLHCPPHTRVLILDDASDDPQIDVIIANALQEASPTWRSQRQRQNLGFVATVNRGMKMTDGDVVLLNSDTVVTAGWIEGLARCLASSPAIATATPWTNNGEIVSIPVFCQSNPVPVNAGAVARIIQVTGSPEYPDLPTAVGFCMAISRRAIVKLGLFDKQLFGLGYGEENDFSMRAHNAGFRNVLCDDVYVVHLGGRSFGPKGLKPDEDTMQKVLSRHPDYLRLVREFIDEDPLARRRDALVEALNKL